MSLKGMTGFARREGGHGSWTWAVEARSVNGRNLETRFRGPPGFEGLERAVREAAQARFQRGQIGVNLQARRVEGPASIKINHDLVERYLKALEPHIAAGRAAVPRADGVLALRGVIETGEAVDDPDVLEILEAAMARDIEAALDDLAEARNQEGRALQDLIVGFIAGIETRVEHAAAAAEAQGPLIRDRFARRLEDLLGEAAPAERIVQEASVMALRADVREELDRMAAHCASARVHLDQGQPVGRQLDFLTQEFMREANTLTAKSVSPALTAVGLELKAVIDRMREQVQNVE